MSRSPNKVWLREAERCCAYLEDLACSFDNLAASDSKSDREYAKRAKRLRFAINFLMSEYPLVGPPTAAMKRDRLKALVVSRMASSRIQTQPSKT